MCARQSCQIRSAQLRTKIHGFDAKQLAKTGTTNLSRLVPKNAYNDAIVNVFYCALAASCVAFVASFFVEWKTARRQPEIAEVCAYSVSTLGGGKIAAGFVELQLSKLHLQLAQSTPSAKILGEPALSADRKDSHCSLVFNLHMRNYLIKVY